MPSRSRLWLVVKRRNRKMLNQKRYIRIFFLIAVAVMALDITPPSFPGMSRPKRWLSAVLNRVGLWQGQWVMFSPDPFLNNAYLTAEIDDKDGNRTYWDSPDWKQASSSEKFYRFRYMNYYNRIYIKENLLATNDFADYLAHTSSRSPVRRLTLVRTKMTMVLPEAEALPKRDDTIWISSSNFLTERHYDP